MKFSPQAIPEVVLIEPAAQHDLRGYFCETYRHDLLEQALGYPIQFVQDNTSQSTRGTLRGLHFQSPPKAQNKLVRASAGRILDVAVDMRHGSPTYGEHVSAMLSEENMRQLLVPKGFAHGFIVLSDHATVLYKVDDYYAPECDCGIHYDDPAIGIDWQLPEVTLQLSDKDKQLPLLADLPPHFEYSPA